MELIEERVLSLGIVEMSKDGYKGCSKDVMKEFVIFYKLLVIVIKLCIAKKDELRLIDKINEY